MIVIKLKKSHFILLLISIIIGIYLAYIACQNKIKYKIEAAHISDDVRNYYGFKFLPRERRKEAFIALTTAGIYAISEHEQLKQEIDLETYCMFIIDVSFDKKVFNKSVMTKIDNVCKNYNIIQNSKPSTNKDGNNTNMAK